MVHQRKEKVEGTLFDREMFPAPDAVAAAEEVGEDHLLSYWELEHKFKPGNKSNLNFQVHSLSREGLQ